MDWTWDRRKAAANLGKHKVSFELAVMVFDDPNHLSRADDYPLEERWQTIGRPLAESALLLLVVHTDASEGGLGGRIISARKATPRERKAYEEGSF